MSNTETDTVSRTLSPTAHRKPRGSRARRRALALRRDRTAEAARLAPLALAFPEDVSP